jgi:glycosyltransferase involved in cell wall biosynthesis/LmbE family N-acetylglucosaminyl deacetylase
MDDPSGLRIAFVSQPGAWGGPPDPQGSIEIWTHEVAVRLASRAGVRVYRGMAVRRIRREKHDAVEYFGVPNRYDRLLTRLLDRLPSDARRPHSVSLLRFLAYAIQVGAHLRSFRPDIIHVQNQFPFARVLRRLNPAATIVLHMHGEWLSDLDRRIVAPALDAADVVVGCSNHVANRASSAWQDRQLQVLTVPNGANESWLSAPRDEAATPEILFVGRLSPEKGIHVLIEAFTDVALDHPDARLKIIGPNALAPRQSIVDVSADPAIRELERFYCGDSKYWKQMEKMVPPHLADRVEFIHSIPQRELLDHYRSATVLVNPSLSESFGMSLVEAMSVGCPVVATTAGGMPEIVTHGQTGLLVEPADVTSLAEAIRTLLRNDGLRRRMGEAGRLRVAGEFTWDVVASRMGDIYAERRGMRRNERSGMKRFERLLAGSTSLDVSALEGSTLVIAPHPDDETLGCGGTIAALAAAGRSVGVVFMTDGGLAGEGTRESIVADRADETRRACEVLGIKPANTWRLGHPDGALGRHATEAVEELRGIIERFAPDRVLVPHADDVHPDHVAAHHITRTALAGRSVDLLEYPIWLWDHWPWTPQPLPLPPNRRSIKLAARAWGRSARQWRMRSLTTLDTSVDVSSFLWVKRSALEAYQSQLPSLDEVGRGRFLHWFDQSAELFRRSGNDRR